MRYMHLSSTEAKKAIALLDVKRGNPVKAAPSEMSPAGFELAVGDDPRNSKKTGPIEGTETVSDSRADSTDSKPFVWADPDKA